MKTVPEAFLGLIVDAELERESSNEKSTRLITTATASASFHPSPSTKNLNSFQNAFRRNKGELEVLSYSSMQLRV